MTVSLGIGGWLGAFYSASLLADAAPFHFEKVANILSGPLVGGILAHAIVAAVGTIPYSFGRVYAAMFTSAPLVFLAVSSITYVFAVLGFRAFYEMQVKTVAQMAADEIAADAAEADAAAAATAAEEPLPESDEDEETENESEAESEGESDGEDNETVISDVTEEAETAVETTAVAEETAVETTSAETHEETNVTSVEDS